jgi:hypothetical protein
MENVFAEIEPPGPLGALNLDSSILIPKWNRLLDELKGKMFPASSVPDIASTEPLVTWASVHLEIVTIASKPHKMYM